MHKSFDPRA